MSAWPPMLWIQKAGRGQDGPPWRVIVYDTLSPEIPAADHEAHMNKMAALDYAHVVRGTPQGHGKSRREKGIHIALAVDALEMAYSGKVDAIALWSGDGNFAPLMEAIRRAGPHAIVVGWDIAQDLADAADLCVRPPAPPDLKRFRLGAT